MAFVTGIYLIDAPASALNMGEGEETTATVKAIRVGAYQYPYVSAQSFRYWLRRTLEAGNGEWVNAPIHTAGKGQRQQAYTEGDPITYWDDDLFGYMRAVKDGTRTRLSPFRTSTLVSIAPVEIVRDFGVMARHEGDPVLHGHEFYATVLKGLFSLNLSAAGTFSYVDRSGHLNLDEALQEEAQRQGLEHLEERRCYRLPYEERVRRVQALLRALGRLQGGARQTLHYTDVAPAFVMAAVTVGGNHIFNRVITAQHGRPVLHEGALVEAFNSLRGDILSSVHVGIAQGFMDDAAETLARYGLTVRHPREALDALADEVAQNPAWWE